MKDLLKDQSHLLLQEIYIDDVWKMMICCIFLNQTNRKQVDKIRLEFFNKYPSPKSVINANVEEIKELISVLGFKNKRTNTIVRFSKEYLSEDWNEPWELYGIGKYGQNSWQMFVKGNLDIEPTDSVLKKYLEKIKLSI